MQYMKTVIGILVIVNPIGTIPFFLGLTEGQAASTRRAVARLASFAATIVLVGSAFLGEPVLSFFGVTIPAFRVAGGLLLLTIAMGMLQAQRPRTKTTPGEEVEAAARENVALVPLAIPLLAGPGAISTMILLASHATGFADRAFLVGACALVGGVSFVILCLAGTIGRVLGRTGINVVTRLFGILLAALGVEFIAGGLVTLMPGLAS
ncbi:MAG: MarC family protein [Planctomycetota bacterium]